MTVLRVIGAGLRFHFKNLSHSGFFILTSVFMPVLIATVAYYMYKAGNREGTLFYASLGAAVYGIWSSTLFGSGGSIQWQRWQGTLELIVSAPTTLILIILPMTLATAAIGAYSLTATLLWGRIVFKIPFTVQDPAAFLVAIPVTILGLGLLGLVFASTFVLYRHANSLSNMLEWPVLLVTGLLLPVSQLQEWTHPIAWTLAPYWGINALRSAALGIGWSAWVNIAITLALAALYYAIGSLCLRHFVTAARRKATLSLT